MPPAQNPDAGASKFVFFEIYRKYPVNHYLISKQMIAMNQIPYPQTDKPHAGESTKADRVQWLLQNCAAVRIGGNSETTSFMNVLETYNLHEKADSLTRILKEQQNISGLAACPIIGVVGLINAGKSALVRSFISAENRDRVLSGLFRDQGTQRFVFWMPGKWESGDLRRQIEQFISANFNQPCEELSIDPETARRQYNDEESFGIPLLAFDSALDQAGIAFLDCPDVERDGKNKEIHIIADDNGDELFVDRHRLDLVRQASELCSGFLMLGTLERIETKCFRLLAKAIRETIPNLPFYGGINKVESNFTPEALLEVFQSHLEQMNFDAIYMAFHFRDSGARDSLPGDVRTKWDTLPDKEALVFFNQNPTSLSPRFIDQLPQVLEPGGLILNRIQMGWEKLRNTVGECTDEIRKKCEAVRARRKKYINAVESVVVDFCTNSKKELITPAHLELQIFRDSIERTAPYGFYGLLKLCGWAEDTVTTAVKFSTFGKIDIQAIQQNSNAHCYTPEHLAEKFAGHEQLPIRDNEFWKRAAEAIFHRWKERMPEFNKEVDPDHLDSLMREEWQLMPLWKKGMAVVVLFIVVVLAIGSCVLAVADFGGTAVVMTTSMSSITAGIGGLFSLHKIKAYLQNKIGLRNLAELLAQSLDIFGLPREPEIRNIKLNEDSFDIDLGKCGERQAAEADLGLGLEIEVDSGFMQKLDEAIGEEGQ